MEQLHERAGDTKQTISWRGTRILYVANSMLASLQLSFIQPLRQVGSNTDFENYFLTEDDFKKEIGKAEPSHVATWLTQWLDSIQPALIVFCRYSGPGAETIIRWARTHRTPTIFHIDDDLLNVPIELGESKYRLHNSPARTGVIRNLLANATLVYCSTERLRERLFGNQVQRRVVAGALYCASEVIAEPPASLSHIVGYMGSDHRHDFQLVLPALLRLLETRPNVRFEMFGTTPLPEELSRFGGRVRKIEPVGDYSGFMQKLSTLDWRIGICTLAKMPFNMVKADTKWVEYTACGVATIASRGTVYDRCCAEGCGLLADGEGEWLSALESLFDDNVAHRKQVERAQERLRREYRPDILREQVLGIFARAHELNGSRVPAARSGFSSGKGAAGRSSARADDGSPGVALWFGDVELGHVLRHINRPDVDRQLEGASGTKGFLLPAGCLNALSQLMGAAGGALEPTIRFGGEVRSLLTTNPLLGDLASFRTLRAATAKQGWRVEDLWWANSRLLKLRMNNRPGEAGEPTATLLRLFQPLPQPAGQPRLALVDELAIAAGASIASVGVRNPLLPLLFVGCDETGEILFTDLVPFPSLLRGGLHEAEAAVVGEQGGTLEDVCRLNDAYLAEAAGWGEAEPAGTIGEIEIDLLAATGAEPIFDPAVGAWLSSFNVALGGANDERRVERDLGDRSFVDHAQVQLARHRPARPRAGCARLCLPSRALPTIGAVVSRRLPVPAARRPGPHIVVDEAFPHRRCLVAFPGGVPQSLYSGPQARLGEMPHLVLLAEPSAEGGGGGEANPVGDHLQPIAILFHELAPKDEALKVFPVPKDQADILPAGAASARVSVISTVLRPNLDVRMLLGTLASQLTGADCELILAVANHHASQLGQLRAILEEALPGRGQVIEVAEALNTSAALNRAALAATGEVLLLVDSSVILHDRRTVETLGRLALREGIGTAGCLQLKSRRAADGVPVFASAGYFPARIDFAIAPHLGLSELDCSEILPRAVYPVAANSGRCLAVAADRWRQAGGLSQRLPNSLADIDLAVRLADAGYTNVCTTLISVFADASPATSFTDLQAPSNLSPWHILPALKASTLIRSF